MAALHVMFRKFGFVGSCLFRELGVGASLFLITSVCHCIGSPASLLPANVRSIANTGHAKLPSSLVRTLVSGMDGTMTNRAKSNQIVFGIFASMAAKLLMMDFEIGHRAA